MARIVLPLKALAECKCGPTWNLDLEERCWRCGGRACIEGNGSEEGKWWCKCCLHELYGLAGLIDNKRDDYKEGEADSVQERKQDVVEVQGKFRNGARRIDPDAIRITIKLRPGDEGYSELIQKHTEFTKAMRKCGCTVIIVQPQPAEEKGAEH
jgi:hypothetical protein